MLTPKWIKRKRSYFKPPKWIKRKRSYFEPPKWIKRKCSYFKPPNRKRFYFKQGNGILLSANTIPSSFDPELAEQDTSLL